MKPWCWWNLLSFMSPPLWHGTEMKTLRCTALLPGGEMRRMWWKFVYLYTASGFYIHFFLSQSKYTSANQSCGENKEAAWHHSKGKTNQTNTTWHHHHQSRSEMMAALLHRTHIWGLVCVCVCVYLALQLALLSQSQVLWSVGHDGEWRLGVMSEMRQRAWSCMKGESSWQYNYGLFEMVPRRKPLL